MERVVKCIPVSVLESKYQGIFTFPYFNTIQSQAFYGLLESDSSVVVSSPTGSGKTVFFELAIIKLLQDMDIMKSEMPSTVIYVAPVKALCSERYIDWSFKFGPLGIKCLELTGDSDINLPNLLLFLNQSKTSIILTTPEKLDSLTRKWRYYGSLLTSIKLILIDEVHLLGENIRGPTLETVVSRMRTIRLLTKKGRPIRFTACSATIPNAIDLAEWLGSDRQKALLFESTEEQRPVKLEKIILGYNAHFNMSLFKFDLSLTYKLPEIIATHSNGKPTLIFCSTRKAVQQTAHYLATNFTPVSPPEVQAKLIQASDALQDSKIREIIRKGVGFHHAGLGINDRRIIEQLFVKGSLPVLISTSTLSLGVNLPAHLVIIKSTTQMISGSDGQEYSAAKLLQMIGRAGRPQFDTSATAVIMTKASLTNYYEELLENGTIVESCLHMCLKEHLNAEVTLGTITHISMAMEWLRTTFLFVRALKQPAKYGIHLPQRLTDPRALRCKVEQYLIELCLYNLNSLDQIGLIVLKNLDIVPTATGKLMARYCITFDTMKLFSQITGREDLSSLLDTLSQSSEFNDVQLRVNERKILNQLNRSNANPSIRFPLPGRISNRQMKVNCLIQAALGCVQIADPTLSQETVKILRLAHKLAKCLAEYLWCQLDRTTEKKCVTSLKNALILSKCLKCGLWENSPFVSKQIEKIGPVLSRNLVDAGFTTFDKLRTAHPRHLEKILNRSAPFGNRLLHLFRRLPRYSINIEEVSSRNSSVLIDIRIHLDNRVDLRSDKSTTSENHAVTFLVSDARNNVLLKSRLTDAEIIDSGGCGFSFTLNVPRASTNGDLEFNLISESWIGLDVSSRYAPILIRGNGHRKHSLSDVNMSAKYSQYLSDPESTPASSIYVEFEDEIEDIESISRRPISKNPKAHVQKVTKGNSTVESPLKKLSPHNPDIGDMIDFSNFGNTSVILISEEADTTQDDTQINAAGIKLPSPNNGFNVTAHLIKEKNNLDLSNFHWGQCCISSFTGTFTRPNWKKSQSLLCTDRTEDFRRGNELECKEIAVKVDSPQPPVMVLETKSKNFTFDFEF